MPNNTGAAKRRELRTEIDGDGLDQLLADVSRIAEGFNSVKELAIHLVAGQGIVGGRQRWPVDCAALNVARAAYAEAKERGESTVTLTCATLLGVLLAVDGVNLKP